MTIAEFQDVVRRTYLAKDSTRPGGGTFLWFVEEVGELAEAIREGAPRKALAEEFADVFAWLVSLANIHGVEMDEAVSKYARGCPRCGKIPCSCPEKRPSGA